MKTSRRRSTAPSSAAPCRRALSTIRADGRSIPCRSASARAAAGVGRALDGAADRPERVLDRDPGPEQPAELPVAPVLAGQEEIARAADPQHGGGPTAAGSHQSAHVEQSGGEDGGLDVAEAAHDRGLTEPTGQPLGHPDGHRHDVLERPPRSRSRRRPTW